MSLQKIRRIATAMQSRRPEILVVGGDSRIGTALLPILTNTAVFVRRKIPDRPGDIAVSDYAKIPPAAFEGKSCVVNCVGIAHGTSADLQRINVDIPERIADAARNAGVRHFIHVSSFSVYGRQPRIAGESVAAPDSAYGRSKLAADEALLALAGDGFVVTILRLPLIYGENSLGKLGQLLAFWERVRLMPVPASDVSRSMISVAMSADIIATLIAKPRGGIVLAGDPTPFRYRDAAAALGGGLGVLPIPAPITNLALRFIPEVGHRLFADSYLSDADNFAVTAGMKSQLYDDIAVANFRGSHMS